MKWLIAALIVTMEVFEAVLPKAAYASDLRDNGSTVAQSFVLSNANEYLFFPYNRPFTQPAAPTSGTTASEDDDDTPKEKVIPRTASLDLSRILEIVYSRQHAIFKDQYREITTPPPRSC
jgi:hypothetical protein